MSTGSDTRLDELDEFIKKERTQLTLLSLRERAVQARLDKYTSELKEKCPHLILEKHSSYDGGSYDTRASTKYWNVCKRCGTTSAVTTEMHNYFG
jgi:hypothetical protein